MHRYCIKMEFRQRWEIEGDAYTVSKVDNEIFTFLCEKKKKKENLIYRELEGRKKKRKKREI